MDEPAYEKLSIRESARSLKKYGSTSSKLATKSENYIKHYVCNSDTLQGIALKYDVSIEQIRRANRLWTSDSLFLKEFLLIPVPLDISMSAASTSTSSTPVSSPMQSQPSYEDEESIDKFLGKIDASIATTKEEVKKTQSNSEFASDLSLEIDRRKPVVSRMKQMVNNNGIGDFLPPPPQTVVIAQGKQVKTSIRRTEQKPDEFFEL
ncbi:lysM and putative peptidoglycan-binding domain-containing protein 2 [Coccinella septempunctata]|uniref:lysM and putative peptidoglycan-binding domain-containing protein 2 n=1 Tax=Coccinella septempunctata TaxID=41139 RepID=UPI001D06F620|nr:lysM and putative peptidoglycan-binding domain-containing protein 2 [Coccinella septempunctata]